MFELGHTGAEGVQTYICGLGLSPGFLYLQLPGLSEPALL